jgi:hypothetical protein
VGQLNNTTLFAAEIARSRTVVREVSFDGNDFQWRECEHRFCGLFWKTTAHGVCSEVELPPEIAEKARSVLNDPVWSRWVNWPLI